MTTIDVFDQANFVRALAEARKIISKQKLDESNIEMTKGTNNSIKRREEDADIDCDPSKEFRFSNNFIEYICSSETAEGTVTIKKSSMNNLNNAVDSAPEAPPETIPRIDGPTQAFDLEGAFAQTFGPAIDHWLEANQRRVLQIVLENKVRRLMRRYQII